MNTFPRQQPLFFRHGGFSLIELLIAIAVIGLLALIVVPSVNHTRLMSQSVQSVSNLRQIGAGMHQYAMHNDGFFPATTGKYNDPVTPGSWNITLMRLLEIPFPEINEPNIFRCPLAQYSYPDNKAKRTYGMNYTNLPTDSSFHASRGWEQRTHSTQHSQPARSVMLIDTRCANLSTADGYDNFTIDNYEARSDWRHNGRILALFVDGHVEFFNRSESERLEDAIRLFGL